MAGTTGRGVVRTGAQGFAVGTAAVAVLGVLQQAIGVFNPRPSMSATIVVAVAFASFVTKRLGARRREDREAAALRRLLVVWPPRPLSDVDPVHLGAFPPRRELGTELPYLPRHLDGELRGALEPGSFVLLHGPRLAGKTRTACEVAGTALRDAPVIVPRSPEALGELLELHPPLDVSGPLRVVWLDDLARYAAMIDPATLDEIRALGAPAPTGRTAAPTPPAVVIATLRSDDWDDLRAASGPEGRGARAVAAVARAFELPSRLTAAELAAARRVYPDEELVEGIGPALASTGRDATAPSPIASPVRDMPRPHPLRDAQLAIPAGLTVAAVTVAALIWVIAGFSTPPIPLIADQLSSVKRNAAREGRRVRTPAGAAALDLHGTGSGSYFLLVEDRPGSGLNARADELRVYDDRGGRLVRRLRFEPRDAGARFQFRAAADIDFDGAVEVVGGYSRPDARAALIPFALDFDDDDRYELTPLALGKPRLTRLDLERKFRIPTRQYRRVYELPISIADRRGAPPLRGRRVQDFVVTTPQWRLVAGYWVQAPLTSGDLGVLELQAAVFGARGGGPEVRRCALAGGIVARTRLRLESRSPAKAIREDWAAASEGRECALVAGRP